MFLSVQRGAGVVLFLVAMMMILGCGGGVNGVNPVVPATDGNNDNQAVYDSGSNLGAFTLTLDPDNLTATIEPVDRGAAINVTRFVDIRILGLQWDPVKRIWDIHVEVENPTQYSGFGPWIVFTETGEQKILNQDGFIWIGNNPGNPPERVPVKAFAKENPERIFYAHSVEFFHLQIHWPDNWHGFQPMEFFVDASFPNPRQQPIIEELQIHPSPIPEQFNLTGYIKDWQNCSSEPPMDVWVDLTPMGGNPHESLFDDGMHGDGEPFDDIWGCGFMGIMPPEPAAFTVYAHDHQGFAFENDVVFGWNEPPPCLPMEVLDEGQWGLDDPLEIIIRNQIQWENLWFDIHPDPNAPPPPRVDFSIDQVVAVALGMRPSTGYFVHVDCVKEIGGPDGGPHTIVDYTEEIPGPDCIVLWVITSPYQLVKTPLTVANDHFFRHEHVYSCGEECVFQRDLDKGFHSNINEPVWEAFRSEGEWMNFWAEHGPYMPPPEVNFSEEMAIVGMIGDRPTSGWSVEIDCVEYKEDSSQGPVILIHATEVEPGPDCIVMPVVTQPYHFIAVPMFEGRIDLILNHVIDPCEPPPCVPIRPLAEGDFSDIHWFTEEMFINQGEWSTFWEMHGENRPAPEVNWEHEYVIALMPDDRPTSGYWINVDCVRLLEDPSYGRITQVEYTLMIPGETCIVEQVVTQPFFYFAVPQLFNSRPEFIMHEEVYECEEPECQPMEVIEDGIWSNIHVPNEDIIRNPDAWHDFWMWHNPDSSVPPPPVNFDENMVVVVNIGTRNTGGFFVEIDCVQFLDIGSFPNIIVDYTEHIPGRGCIVPQVFTYPYQFVAVPRFEGVAEFRHHELVYDCP